MQEKRTPRSRGPVTAMLWAGTIIFVRELEFILLYDIVEISPVICNMSVKSSASDHR